MNKQDLYNIYAATKNALETRLTQAKRPNMTPSSAHIAGSLAVYTDAEGNIRKHFTLSASRATPTTTILIIKVLV